MNRHIIVSLIGFLLLCSCSRQHAFIHTLREAELHMTTAPDSTLQLLDQIADAACSNDYAVRARYTLLRAQASWRLYAKTPSDTALASTVAFFRNPIRQPELCTAIYYRAMPLYEHGEHAEATALLIEGERMAEDIGNDSLCSKYYESLCMVNENAHCYDNWLHYAKKFLRHSLFINNVEYIIRGMNEVAGAFGKLGQRDSSMAYLLQTMSMLDNTTTSDKSMMLANIGCKFLSEEEPDKAEQYLLASIQTEPRANALSALGDLYAQRGERQKADSLWRMALQTSTPAMKLLTLRSMLEQRLNNSNDSDELTSLYSSIRQLEDSLNLAANTETIAEIQAKYDKERSLSRYYRYLSYRLNGKIRELQADINMRIGKGKIVYETILAKEKLPSNDPSGESCLIAYYSVLKYSVYQEWIKAYSGLSTRLLTFLVLKDMGFDDAKIANILSVENSTIRSIKTRLKKRLKK